MDVSTKKGKFNVDITGAGLLLTSKPTALFTQEKLREKWGKFGIKTNEWKQRINKNKNWHNIHDEHTSNNGLECLVGSIW